MLGFVGPSRRDSRAVVHNCGNIISRNIPQGHWEERDGCISEGRRRRVCYLSRVAEQYGLADRLADRLAENTLVYLEAPVALPVLAMDLYRLLLRQH
nr:hypothetical protein CFP56_12122 [Quercus suber]